MQTQTDAENSGKLCKSSDAQASTYSVNRKARCNGRAVQTEVTHLSETVVQTEDSNAGSSVPAMEDVLKIFWLLLQDGNDKAIAIVDEISTKN